MTVTTAVIRPDAELLTDPAHADVIAELRAEGLPDTCPCSCLTCSRGPCECTVDGHARSCTPAIEAMDTCAERYAGPSGVLEKS